MQARHRKAILFAVLACTVALIALDPFPDRSAKSSGAGISTERPDARGVAVAAKSPATPPTLALPERASLGKPAGDLFGSQSWQPPPPKVAAAPAPPSAPPMPYRFAGKLVHNGELQLFLSKGDAPIPIKQGEILDGAYRVESISEERVTLIYLPLGRTEVIPVVSALTAAPTAAPLFGAGPPVSGGQPAPGAVPFGPAVASTSRVPFPGQRDSGGTTASGPESPRLTMEGLQQRR